MVDGLDNHVELATSRKHSIVLRINFKLWNVNKNTNKDLENALN